MSNQTKEKLYNTWRGMRARCYNKKDKSYKYYGGRGIEICQEWKDDYKAFKKWAYENGYEEGLTIERKDTNKNYEPSNCCWKTMKEQSNNRRGNINVTYHGKTQTISQWADELGFNYDTLNYRIIEAGWPIEKAFNTKTNFRVHPEWDKQIIQLHINHPEYSGTKIAKEIGCGETKVYTTLQKYNEREVYI